MRKTNSKNKLASPALTFSSRCYQVLKKVPRGKVTTYGEIAKCLGVKSYRGVGQAMARNPDAPIVPCHRVVRADGSLGGYNGGLPKKIKLLGQEGISVKNGKVVDFEKKLYSFR